MLIVVLKLFPDKLIVPQRVQDRILDVECHWIHRLEANRDHLQVVKSSVVTKCNARNITHFCSSSHEKLSFEGSVIVAATFASSFSLAY